jgi:nanoRNase/pAp phosphatase (c-di-AMP/oligoRNAs hydrolase)
MVRRLVLGCGDAGRRIVGVASTWGGELLAVVGDADRATDLEAEGTRVIHGDPTDPDTYPETADVVVVAGDDGATNLAAARRARESFPDALLVACAGPGTAGIETVADRTIDPVTAVGSRLLHTTADAERAHRLLDVLRDIDGCLAVVTHDNPDPDAIASALALVRIARTVGVEAEVCYYGEISHQENQALVNLLDLDLRSLDPDGDLAAYGAVALVDHSRPGVNDGLSPDTDVEVVIDHHPPRGPADGRFLDLRSGVGATSTLLVEYLDRLDIVPDPSLATALLYGIRVDTKEFTRETSDADFEAAAFLLEYADQSVLDRVESPSMSPEVLETLAAAIENRDVRGDVLVAGAGHVRDRDAIAQAADRLLDMEGITVSVVYGIMDDTVYVSGRARGAGIDLGEALRDALDAIGSAGGHADMAGAQISLGILGAVEETATESLRSVVDEVITQRVFEVLENPPEAPRHDDTVGVGFASLFAEE